MTLIWDRVAKGVDLGYGIYLNTINDDDQQTFGTILLVTTGMVRESHAQVQYCTLDYAFDQGGINRPKTNWKAMEVEFEHSRS